jgi:hypothetical protein
MMCKKFAFTTALLMVTIIWTPMTWAHGGVTPSQVITDMKHNQRGPYAAPLLRGRSLAQDWLGFKGEDYQTGDISGVLIREVVPEGLADSEDMEKGDVIVEANGQPISSLADLEDFMAQLKTRSEVEFTLLRNGKRVKESVYVQATLKEIAPEMDDIMQGRTKPQPGMMMEGMMAKTPLAGISGEGQLKPGMFMEEMMQRTPMGRLQNNKMTGRIIFKSNDPLKNFVDGVLDEISGYEEFRQRLDISDKQLESLHKLQLDYKKQRVKIDADFNIVQLDLEEALRGDKVSLDKLEEVLRDRAKLEEKSREQTLNFLKGYFSIIDKEQRVKLRQFSQSAGGE